MCSSRSFPPIKSKKEKEMSYLFTSESVSEGHPDKIADQLSDQFLDHFLAFDPESKVAIENMVTTGQVIVAGEVKSKTYVDIQKITRETIKKIGYDKDDYYFSYKSLGVLSAIHDQSEDINQGVVRETKEKQGAGDQGMMFGYATDETKNFIPLTLDLAHQFVKKLAQIRKEGKEMPYLRPDSKSQVTVEYDDNNRPVKIDTIVISTQHDPFDKDEKTMLKKIESDIQNILIPAVIKDNPDMSSLFYDYKLLVNPTGKFIIGGPHGDTGLTGRKIIVDTYGGKGAHGGGAFSGKDPSKVDRSGAYMARYIAKNIVAAGIAKEILIQVSYAIGVAEPVSIYVNTYGTAQNQISDKEIQKMIIEIFDLTPAGIEKTLKLRNPIYAETAAYGHFGRTPKKVLKHFERYDYTEGKIIHKEIEVEIFTWEKTDKVKDIQKYFSK
jgi:S-adenosylmethionine synthetase